MAGVFCQVAFSVSGVLGHDLGNGGVAALSLFPLFTVSKATSFGALLPLHAGRCV